MENRRYDRDFQIGDKVLFKHVNALYMGFIDSFNMARYKIIYLESSGLIKRISIPNSHILKIVDNDTYFNFFNNFNINSFMKLLTMNLQELESMLKGTIYGTYRTPVFPPPITNKKTLKSDFKRKSLQLRKDLIKLEKYLDFKITEF